MQRTAHDNAANKYVGSERDPISPKLTDSQRKLRLILRKNFTFRDINKTETDKAGLQPWTAVSLFLEIVRTV